MYWEKNAVLHSKPSNLSQYNLSLSFSRHLDFEFSNMVPTLFFRFICAIVYADGDEVDFGFCRYRFMYIIPICIYVDKIGINKVQQKKKKMFTQVHIQHPINVILYFQIGICVYCIIYMYFFMHVSGDIILYIYLYIFL